MSDPPVRFFLGGRLLGDQLRAIGLIVTTWAATEHLCAAVITKLLKADDIAGAVATSGMQSRTLIHVFRLLALNAYPADQPKIAKMYKRLEQGLKIRNDVAHANWDIGTAPDRPDGYGARAAMRKVTHSKTVGFSLMRHETYSVHQLLRRALFLQGIHVMMVRFLIEVETGRPASY